MRRTVTPDEFYKRGSKETDLTAVVLGAGFDCPLRREPGETIRRIKPRN